MEYLSSILLIIAIAALLYFDRKNIKREGIIFLRRSQLLIEKIESVSKRYRTIINLIGIVSIIIGFLVMFYSFYFLVSLLFVKTNIPAVQVVLPSLPGICESNIILCISPIYWILSILIIAFSHEIMHALLASANKIRIKSVGYAFFLIIPAFFVEPNEKQLKKSSILNKLKVYSAGSFGNFIVAFLIFFVLFIIYKILYPFYEFYGLEVEVLPNSSAFEAGVKGIITKINNESATIKNLLKTLKNISKDDYITLTTTEGEYNVKPKDGKIGISIKKEIYVSENYLLNNTLLKDVFDYSKNFSFCLLENSYYCNFVFNSFLAWLFILNIGIAIFNLLPIKPLDGGLMLNELLRPIFPKHHEKISNMISLAGFAILIILILKPYF